MDAPLAQLRSKNCSRTLNTPNCNWNYAKVEIVKSAVLLSSWGTQCET